MRKSGTVALPLSALILGTLIVGCTDNNTTKIYPNPGLAGAGGASSKKNRTPLEAKGWATLVGRVVYDDAPPPKQKMAALSTHDDKAVCLDGKEIEINEQVWMVDPNNKGVANTVLYFKSPAGTFFRVHPDDKKRTDEVVLDQPHCNYVPHVVSIYPKYVDVDPNGHEILKPSGQRFVIKNSSAINHNTKFLSGFNKTLGGQGTPWVINQSSSVDVGPQARPFIFSCDIHKWMQAYGWSFEHPYHSVTQGGGLEDAPTDWGKFKIERIPAGAKMSLHIWHEGTFRVSEIKDAKSGQALKFDAQQGAQIQFKDKEIRELLITISK